MINVSKLYCGIDNLSDNIRFRSDENSGFIFVYNCTNKCNQECLHCYSRTDSFIGSQLDTNQAKEVLIKLSAFKSSVILFSGGEPLERSDIFELLSFSSSHGLRTVLSTNGSLIDSDAAKRLADIGVKYVGISIDGNHWVHDNFRGTKGSFVKAMEAVSFCKNVGIKTGLRFTIMNMNFNQIRILFSLASMLSISRICFYHLISVGGAAKNNLKCTNEQITKVLNDVCKYAQHYAAKGITEVLTVGNHADGPFILNRLKLENSSLYNKSFDLLEKFGGNKIGVRIFAIDPAGNVHPDQFWQNFSLGNLMDDDVEKIMKNSYNIFVNKTSFVPDRCKKCKWLNRCGTNARFAGEDFKSAGFLEPDCYLENEVGIEC